MGNFLYGAIGACKGFPQHLLMRGAHSASIFQNFELDSINGQKEIAAGYSYSRDVFAKGGSCKERQRETKATARDEDDEDDEDLEEAYYGGDEDDEWEVEWEDEDDDLPHGYVTMEELPSDSEEDELPEEL